MKKQSWDITDPVTGDKYTLEKGMQVVVVRESNRGLNGHEHKDNNLFKNCSDEAGFIGSVLTVEKMIYDANTITGKWIRVYYPWFIYPSLVRPYNPPTP